MPDWLSDIAWISLILAALCAMAIALDLMRYPQSMSIMNIVWPLTALYAGPLGILAYVKMGRQTVRADVHNFGETSLHAHKPLWQSVAVGATHCGSGCLLADIVVEVTAFFIPVTLFGNKIFGVWTFDYALALIFGIAFQYLAIKTVNLSPVAGLKAALKADILSLTAWQIGMYSWMAIALFVIFSPDLPKTDPVFWFMMQFAMIAGFLTSYPVNWWLISRGIKERM